MNTRDQLHIVLEGAVCRHDQYKELVAGKTPDDAITELWEAYDENSTTDAEFFDAMYEGAIKEVRENVVTNQEALMAMMLYENALSARWYVGTQGGGLRASPLLDWLCADEGAYEARDSALLIAQVLVPVSEWAYDNGYDESEDWEFLPDLMREIMTLCAKPKDLTPALAMAAAKMVVEDFLDDVRKKQVGYLVANEPAEDGQS